MSPAELFSNPITLQGGACFVSDAHFRVPEDAASREREEKLIRFIERHKGSFSHFFMLGDMFDFWFEYRDVVPKGYFRLFNALYELHQAGVEIYFFAGNHDMWVRDYFTASFGCHIFHQEQAFIIQGRRCLVGHGDGLGSGQFGYKLIKSIFGFKPNQVLYSMLHPRQAFSIARACSQKSRKSHTPEMLKFAQEKETQVQYARAVLASEKVDCFVFGHRHIPVTYRLNETAMFFNTGDWLENFSYLIINEEGPELLFYHDKLKKDTTIINPESE